MGPWNLPFNQQLISKPVLCLSPKFYWLSLQRANGVCVQGERSLLRRECLGPRSGPGICILSPCPDVVRKEESGMTLCLWGDFRMVGPWLILETPPT